VKLHPYDWDAWRLCPADERTACVLYEYSREAERQRPGFMAKQFPDPSFDPVAVMMRWAEWPGKAYLSIPVEERKKRLAKIDLPIPDQPLLFPGSIAAMSVKSAPIWVTEMQYWQSKSGWPSLQINPEVWETAFRIEWKFSDAQLVEQFRNWLRRYRPQSAPGNSTPTAHGSLGSREQVALKRLGALRLLNTRPYSKLIEDEDPAIAQLYSDQAAWSKAQHEAQEMVNFFTKTGT
jgi:hypothetical protein